MAQSIDPNAVRLTGQRVLTAAEKKDLQEYTEGLLRLRKESDLLKTPFGKLRVLTKEFWSELKVLNSQVKAFTGVNALALGSLYGLYRELDRDVKMVLAYRNSLYEVSRSFNIGTTNMNNYRKQLSDLSSTTGRNIIEVNKLVTILRSSYTTANLSASGLKDIVKVLANEFPNNVEESTKQYTDFLKQLPYGETLLKKTNLTTADMAEVFRATGGNIDFFIRVWSRMHGVIAEGSDELMKAVKRTNEWNTAMTNLRLGVVEPIVVSISFLLTSGHTGKTTPEEATREVFSISVERRKRALEEVARLEAEGYAAKYSPQLLEWAKKEVEYSEKEYQFWYKKVVPCHFQFLEH